MSKLSDELSRLGVSPGVRAAIEKMVARDTAPPVKTNISTQAQVALFATGNAGQAKQSVVGAAQTLAAVGKELFASAANRAQAIPDSSPEATQTNKAAFNNSPSPRR